MHQAKKALWQFLDTEESRLLIGNEQITFPLDEDVIAKFRESRKG